jgi:hypothetical protein
MNTANLGMLAAGGRSDTVHGVPNKQLSLAKARATFRAVDVGDERRRQFVRDSFPFENPPELDRSDGNSDCNVGSRRHPLASRAARLCRSRPHQLEFAELGYRKTGI